jgi:hypothetical protein
LHIVTATYDTIVTVEGGREEVLNLQCRAFLVYTHGDRLQD